MQRIYSKTRVQVEYRLCSPRTSVLSCEGALELPLPRNVRRRRQATKAFLDEVLVSFAREGTAIRTKQLIFHDSVSGKQEITGHIRRIAPHFPTLGNDSLCRYCRRFSRLGRAWPVGRQPTDLIRGHPRAAAPADWLLVDTRAKPGQGGAQFQSDSLPTSVGPCQKPVLRKSDHMGSWSVLVKAVPHRVCRAGKPPRYGGPWTGNSRESMRRPERTSGYQRDASDYHVVVRI